jgi:hypothetical protein
VIHAIPNAILTAVVGAVNVDAVFVVGSCWQLVVDRLK